MQKGEAVFLTDQPVTLKVIPWISAPDNHQPATSLQVNGYTLP